MPDTRVRPVPNELTRPYWAAASRGQLALQRCQDCAAFTHPPVERCRSCGSMRRDFETVSGRGEVETFSVVYRTFAPGFADQVPYVIAWIALDEQPGLRVFGNLPGVSGSEVRVGLRVEVGFEVIEGFGLVPCFRPSGEGRSCGSA